MTLIGADAPRTTARGRPSKQDAMLLRGRIHASALQCFHQQGFAGTSIDGIARAAGVSRTTIYALYTDKRTLFREMIQATITGLDMARRVTFDDRPPVVVLRDAMVALNGAYYREPNLEILRLCIAEADRFPTLFEEVRDVLARSLTGLTRYFARMRREGKMIEQDCEQASILFNMLSLGTLKPFFIHQDRLTQAEINGHIDLALRLFVRGCFIAEHWAEPATPAT